MSRLALAEASPVLNDIQRTQAYRGRFKALLIKAGWGSSGYYSEEVLKRDGPGVWPAGTQMYLNHPGLDETINRPERAVQDLASVTLSDPVWDPVEKGLIAEVQVFEHWRPMLNEEFVGAVGLSIRAYGTAELGEAEGREGHIITSLTEGESVDWVTRAGAGGKVLELIESARATASVPLAEGRNVGAWFESKIHSSFTLLADEMYGGGRLSRAERIGLSNGIGDGLAAFTARVEADHPQLYKRDLWDGPDDDTELSENAKAAATSHGMTAHELSNALSDAVRAAHGGPDRHAWTCDTTESWAVFRVDTGSATRLVRQSYVIENGKATLTGDPVEVVAHTTYSPAGQPAPAATTTTKEAGTMPEITKEQERLLAEAEAVRKERDDLAAKLAESKPDDKPTAPVAEAVQPAHVDVSPQVLEQLAELRQGLDEANRRAQESDQRAARLEAERIARTKVTEAVAGSSLPEQARTRVVESVCRALTFTEGQLDTDVLAEATKTTIATEEAYIASLAETMGAGSPRGLGGSPITEAQSTEDFEKRIAESFSRLGMSTDAAQIAAVGRR